MDIDLDDISNKLTFLSLSKESQDKLKNQIPEPIEYFNPKTKAKIICVPQNSHPVKNYNLQAFKVESKLSRCGIKASFNEKTFLDTGFYGNEVMESRKIPEKLNLKPHSHQVEGFTWLVHTELTHRGGIIADDPGLGKTVR
jgi:SNF2 family DNA or RNA helicase